MGIFIAIIISILSSISAASPIAPTLEEMLTLCREKGIDPKVILRLQQETHEEAREILESVTVELSSLTSQINQAYQQAMSENADLNLINTCLYRNTTFYAILKAEFRGRLLDFSYVPQIPFPIEIISDMLMELAIARGSLEFIIKQIIENIVRSVDTVYTPRFISFMTTHSFPAILPPHISHLNFWWTTEEAPKRLRVETHRLFQQKLDHILFHADPKPTISIPSFP